MKRKRKPLFNWFRITVIVILIILLILIIFGIVYAPLSGQTNKYTEGLHDLAMKLDECIYDSDCTNNSYCYIGKCICINGWSGDICDVPCEGIFQSNCSLDSGCSYGSNQTGICHFGLCNCDPGYDGPTCNFERRDAGSCLTDTPCNDGYCVLVPPTFSYGECYCPENTSGWNCVPI